VARAKKCGFDVLEVNAPKVTLMSKAEQDKLKAAEADAGLSLTYSSYPEVVPSGYCDR